jgi:hypothetical protein
MATPAAVLVYVLALLGRSAESFPPIVLISAAPSYASRNAEAFVLRDPDQIFLITSTRVFRQAQRADPTDVVSLRKLASILIHEEWHVRHGPDEAGAYNAQLRTLFLLGARPESPEYHSVQASMTTVLAQRDTARFGKGSSDREAALRR